MKKFSLGLIFIFLVFVDQITKIASGFFSNNISFINPICNKYIAWGLPVKPAFFYPLWLAIIFLLIMFFWQKNNSRIKIGFIFILSGAVSNLIDRFLHSCVIDFIDIKVWPIFNLADVYIIIGATILLILKILKPKLKKIKKFK